MALSFEQVAGLAFKAGIPAPQVPIATAIAAQESQLNPQAHNATPPDDSYGLWQINMLGSMGPERRAKYGLSSNEQLYDPGTNARIMVDMSGHGSHWGDWTTYTSGAYLRSMPEAQAAAAKVTAPGFDLAGLLAGIANGLTGGAAGGAIQGVEDLVKLLKALADPKTWRSAAIFIIGAVLIFLGVMKLYDTFVLRPLVKKGAAVGGAVVGARVGAAATAGGKAAKAANAAQTAGSVAGAVRSNPQGGSTQPIKAGSEVAARGTVDLGGAS